MRPTLVLDEPFLDEALDPLLMFECEEPTRRIDLAELEAYLAQTDPHRHDTVPDLAEVLTGT